MTYPKALSIGAVWLAVGATAFSPMPELAGFLGFAATFATGIIAVAG